MLDIPQEVPISSHPLLRFESLLGEERLTPFCQLADQFQEELIGCRVWNINSTAAGGGVAEMLRSLLPYARSTRVDIRWLVFQGDNPFFEITKRIHNGLHGSVGDGGLLGKDERSHYESITQANLAPLSDLIQPGDRVILHDPQTAGLVAGLKACGARVVWRCHIGHDFPNELVQRSWDFLHPYLREADAFCFTRASYAPSWVPPDRLCIIHPSIDPFSPKNQDMEADTARAIVAHLGIITPPGKTVPLAFHRNGGVPATIEGHADILHAGPLPCVSTPLVVQVSRWDRLKDMAGVMRGFSDHVAEVSDAHLALVGPNVHGVSDDPEGADAYEQCVSIWRKLPHQRRSRVQLVTLPMHDVEENAAMVNAIQRHATVVVQKSLYEGFGLTVAEALWKSRPVVASAVGGIQDQITDGTNGLLVHDPTNLEEFGQALLRFLLDSELAQRCGKAGRQTVLEHFLPTRHLMQYANLLLRL